MRYIGSKLRLIYFIEDTVKKYCGEIDDKVFCDLFGGTGIVGRSFSPLVKKVIANDIEKYSYISNYVGLKGFDQSTVENRLKKLNEVEGTEDSTLFQSYSEGGSCGRLYFSNENGKKLAAARKLLDKMRKLSFGDYLALLLSIIEGADKVSNTMSTYGAYAKNLKENSKKPIFFDIPKKAENASENNEVYCSDANELIKHIEGDILYLDPPYNNRQYGSNYHVLNAIAVGEAPETDSVTGVKKASYNKSDYCKEKTVYKALDELIANSNFEWIFLSYNNEGLLTFDDIREIMLKYGDYYVEGKEYQRYKADNNRKQAANCVVEYIHVLHKGYFNGGMDEEEIQRQLNLSVNCIGEDEAQEEYDEEETDINNAEPETKEQCDIVVSPMNYMGGKKKLIKQLKAQFPKDIDLFVDLFCGGATVGINSGAKLVRFNDNIVPLIEMYKYMRDHSVEECVSYIDKTIEDFGLVQGEEGKDNYYNFRDNYYNAKPANERHPLDLFVLMAFSFNNQIRFAINKNWKFNIPFGKNRSSFNGKMRENLIGFITALHNSNCEFSSYDFRDFPFYPNMFVYADPPYLISQATYNDGWDENSEKELLCKLKQWNDLGVKFALSNVLENKGKTNDILKQWAETNGFNVIHLEKSYANSYYQRKEKDSKTDEVLITNYDI